MKQKYFLFFLTLISGLSISTEKALADVVVKWQNNNNHVNIQKAIDTGDDTIIIPKASKPWLVGDSIRIKKPNQKIIFKPGVVLQAQKGAFKNKTHSMIIVQADNITLSGYDATLKMRKADYQNPQLYQPSQFRHNIAVRGANNFTIEGLTLKDSGGDGIIVTHGLKTSKNKLPARKYSSGTIRDVVADNNHRQGISVVSAKNLLVENSTFRNTSGTNPSTGLDIEPDYGWQKISNVQFKNTNFINNKRHGIQIALGKYRGTGVEDISISFENCNSIGNGEYGVKILGTKAGFYDGPQGFINFKDSEIKSSGQHGIWYKSDQKNPAQTFEVNFENTSVINTAKNGNGFYPVMLWNTKPAGGITNVDFGNDFLIVDNKSRPPIMTNTIGRKQGFTNISGTVKVNNPQQKPVNLGNNLKNVTLEIK